MDEQLNENETVLAHKLCGAGNGGFFLVFSEKDSLTIPYQSVKIDVESNGVIGKKL
jgi:galactokinase/mevalonate kinase-like predicted kinase